MLSDLRNKAWWSYLEADLQELLTESALLIDQVKNWEVKFHDYSFIVFPTSKAYEGFLKKMFLDMGFISENDYYGKHFRIGKALNPQLEGRLRAKYSVYDRVVNYCGGKPLADELWDTWKSCRNLVFHWFPDERKAVSYEDAKAKVGKVINAMDAAFKDCKVGS